MSSDVSSPFLPVSTYHLPSSFHALFCLYLPVNFFSVFQVFSFLEVSSFGIRVPGILCTCKYHMSCLFFISSTILCITYIISLIRSFVILCLDLLAALPEKSTSAASNVRFVVSLIEIISQLFIKVLYVSILLLLFMFISQSSSLVQ